VRVYLAWGRTARSEPLDGQRVLRYDAAGDLIGAEFAGAGRGVDLRGIPERRRFEELLRDLDLKISA
jgi:hypothetical protein